ncbi:MAG: NACHT domain-containing protein [Caldilinea sp. CFX5]|nr:NACHT domain-containing protein [Caldilinea sp. CFX5]
MPVTTTLAFGPLLKHLRKQAGMTQRDLAAALGYSESLICNLEKAQRLPDLQAVTARFIPALGLQDDPNTAAALIEQAALSRGERPPASVTWQRTTQLSMQEALAEPVYALPAPPTAVIGRSVEVNQLCNRLLGHGGRLLTLLGPPGIGKTTLALAVATHLQKHYPDGAVFVPLAAVNDSTLLASTILTAVGSTDLNPPQNKLIAFLRRKTMLLVLDNLEQLLSPPLSGVGLIAEVVAECPGVCILATSRERLHLRAEQRYKVPPLELAPSVELFVQRAQAVDPDFRLSPHNQPTLEAICQRLDCLPLALELCAAQIELFSPTQLLAQLQVHPLDLLVDGARDLPPQQRTLRAAIGRSYALLNDTERLLLRSLAVFVGGFALSAVETVSAWDQATGAPPLVSTLHSLIGKSLVRTETLPSGEQRFLLLETIREFALEQALAQGEQGGLRQRHYAAYLQCFRTGDHHLRGAEATIWLARLQPELDNLRAALHWSLNAARTHDAAWLMLAVSYFWVAGGHGYEETRWLAQLLPSRQTLAPDLRLAILLTFYRSAFALEEYQPIERYMTEIMALTEGCAYKILQASTWCFVAWTTADHRQAAVHIEQGIALADAQEDGLAPGPEFGAIADRDFALATHLWGYAVFLFNHGEIGRSASIITQSLQRYRQRGNRTGIGECLGMLGRLALLQGDLTQAHNLFQEVVTIATSVNYTAMQCEWQSLLAITILYGGDTAEAQRLLNESLRRCLDQKNTILLAQICIHLAEVALWEGEIAPAEQWLAQSVAYHLDQQKVTIYEVERLWVAARLATAQQQSLRAATLFGLADQAHSQIHYAIAGPMRALADAALATVQTALEPAIFAEAFAAGQQMSLAEAFATILE